MKSECISQSISRFHLHEKEAFPKRRYSHSTHRTETANENEEVVLLCTLKLISIVVGTAKHKATVAP